MLPVERISMASGFIGGDPTRSSAAPRRRSAMPSLLPDYRGTWMLEVPALDPTRGPAGFNAALLEFLRGL